VSEYLTVRISRYNPEVSWAVWNSTEQTLLDSGGIEKGPIESWDWLEPLTLLAQQRTVILLLSAVDVVLRQVTVPAGGARQIEQMLPYLLEDDIAQDVDSLHFSLLAKQGDQAFVAAIDHAWFGDLLSHCDLADINISQVIPDVLLLPTHDGVTLIKEGDQWLLRRAKWLGASIADAWLPLCLDSLWLRDESTNTVYSYSPLPEISLSDDVVFQQQAPLSLHETLAQNSVVSKITLLTGKFKRHSSWSKHWLVWRKVAYAATFLAILSMVTHWLFVGQLEQQALAYRSESERIFRSVFPEKQKIPTSSYLKREIDTEAARLSGGVSQSSVLKLLEVLTASLANVERITIQKLRFDDPRGELRIDVQGQDFQSFDIAREQLERNFIVEQGQLTRSGEDVLGSYTLKQK
jgi:general secretion pathway protein L